ncbi:alpha-ketoglutarate-dependent dioxygenase alkB homolog 4 [Prorops nasuta]|uniref:alpha-ketoglutarate-dependent dioxygenase alkB homolog 4 n=1 Tax=Prorops nasuta TaxID=863751 RepID=UPI0034CFD16F
METVRSCGCKGIRSCLICERQFNISKSDLNFELQKYPSYVYCPLCDKCWPGWDIEQNKIHPDHAGESLIFPGVYIELDFLNSIEAQDLTTDLDKLPWDSSQSGRRKQNFGPKCNFKKRKLKLGAFIGFPKTTEFVQKKFDNVKLLENFQTIEQCSLEYNPERGASIDPHIDDCWIWGERIITVNVLGDSVLTMIPYMGPSTRYNLNYVSNFKNINLKQENQIIVRLPMPARSLMVLYGEARYGWEHAVLREDVCSRRVCLAYREFTPPYLSGGKHNDDAIEILKQASNFW